MIAGQPHAWKTTTSPSTLQEAAPVSMGANGPSSLGQAELGQAELGQADPGRRRLRFTVSEGPSGGGTFGPIAQAPNAERVKYWWIHVLRSAKPGCADERSRRSLPPERSSSQVRALTRRGRA